MNTVYRPYLHPRSAPPFLPALFAEAGLAIGAATCEVSSTAQAAGVIVAAGSSSVVTQAFAGEGSVTFDAVAFVLVEASLSVQPIVVGGNQNSVALVEATLVAEGRGGAVLPQQCNASVSVVVQANGTRITHGQSAGAGALDAKRFVERWIDNRPDYRFSNGRRTRQFFQRRR